jgi:hypothetical protein
VLALPLQHRPPQKVPKPLSASQIPCHVPGDSVLKVGVAPRIGSFLRANAAMSKFVGYSVQNN